MVALFFPETVYSLRKTMTSNNRYLYVVLST